MEESAHGSPLIGAWRLVSFHARGSNGDVSYPFGKDAQGSIIYTESGRFTAQLARPGRPPFSSSDQMKGTSEEMEASYKGFISYFGQYECDRQRGVVIHRVEGSLFPNWEGQALMRYFVLSGNRLTLTTPPTSWGGGGEIVAIVEWERAS